MATNYDSFPITPAMLAPAWVKPATKYYPGDTVTGSVTIYTNATDAYLPNSTLNKAGACGGPNAVQPSESVTSGRSITVIPNNAFAATIDPGQEKTPYPNTVTTMTAIECDATLVLPQDFMTSGLAADDEDETENENTRRKAKK